jgi:autotransporter-associated beta strand protein
MNPFSFLRFSFFGRASAKTSRGAVFVLAGLAGLQCDHVSAQPVVSTGDVIPGPAVSPTWNVGADLRVAVSGPGTLTISSGGLVSVGSYLELGTVIGASGTLTLDTGGILQLGGTNGLRKGGGTAAFNFSGGTLQVTGSDLTTSVAATLTNNSTVDTSGFNAALTGALTGTGGLNKTGAGALTLSAANTYGGGTHLSEGTLRVGSDTALGTGVLTIEAGTTLAAVVPSFFSSRTIANDIVVNGDFSIFPGGTMVGFSAFSLTGDIDLTGGDRTITNPSLFSASEFGLVNFGGVISNGGLTLLAVPDSYAFFSMDGAQSNTYTGDTVIGTGVSLQLLKTGGALAIAGDLFIENDGVAVVDISEQIANTSAVTITGLGRLQVGASMDVTETIGSLFGDGEVELNDDSVGSTLRVGAGEFSGTITVGMAGGTALEKIGGGTLVLTGANTYLGNTVISGGVLQIGDGGITGTLGAGDVTNNASLVFDRGDALTVASLISGTGGVTQQGAGALTLTRANTYSGGTTLAEGTLRVGHDSALGTGALTIGAGTTLATDGSPRTIANDLVVNGDFSIFPEGTMIGFSAFSLTGDVDLTGGTRTITNPSDFGAGEDGVVDLGGVISNGGLTLKALTGGNAFFKMSGSQSNTYTGDTVVDTGVSLELARNAQTSIAGDLFINDGAVVKTAWSTQIAETSSVTIAGTGRLEIGTTEGRFESIEGLFGDGEVALFADALAGGGLDVRSGVFSGEITGGAPDEFSVVKEGAGLLVLSGANTFLGNTLVNGGTLQLGDGGTTGSLAGAIELRNGSSLVFDRSDAFTVANVISGNGTMTKNGSGILTLEGNNTYSGGTTVNEGLVVFADGNNFGSGDITLDGGGLRWATGNTLDISDRLNPLGAGGGIFDTNGNDVTFASVISGAGQLTKDGAGALTLTGVNTYTGGTLVLGGELVVTLDGLPGDVEVGSGAFIVFDQNPDGTFTGLVSGAGGVRYNGEGTITLAAVQTYTGETEVNAGALLATAAILEDRDISLSAGAGLILNQTDTGIYAGELSGAGGFLKLGSGTLEITGANTYSGPTLVNAGGLLVNGSLGDTTVTVGSGAFLGGSGTIAGDVVIQSGGFLRPGNSPGILTVGSLLLNAGSFTEMEINGPGVAGTDYDQIRVTGEATLGGTLEILLGGGYVPQAGDSFVLIDADTITAGSDFDVINGLGNALVFDTTITDDFTLSITVLQTDYLGFALTPNQRSVARNLDSDWTSPEMEPVITYLNGLPGSSLPAAFDLIAPEEYAALPRVAQSNTRAMWSGLRQRFAEIRGGSTGWSVANLNLTGRSGHLDLSNGVLLAAVGDTADAIGMRALAAQAQAEQAQADEQRGFFVSGTGTYGDSESDGNAAGYDFAAGGITAGTDVRLTPDAAVGVMVGYGHTDTDYQGASSTIEMETARVGLYGTWSGLNQSWLNATAGGAYHWYDSDREALGGDAAGETEGIEFNALVEAGRDIQSGRWTLTPSAALDYLWLRVDGFEESGSLAPLVVSRESAESLRSELALTVAYRIQAGNTLWSPYVRAGWQHEFLDTQAAVEARLASGAGGMFSVEGTRLERDSALLGAGIQGRLSPALDVGLAYSGELNADYQTHGVNANVRLRF